MPTPMKVSQAIAASGTDCPLLPGNCRFCSVSMEPRYYAGEAVFLNPHLPVRQGDFVVAQIGGEYEGDDVGAYVKRFVSMNSSELILEQFTPREDADAGESERDRFLLRFPRNRVIAVHKIIMSGIV